MPGWVCLLVNLSNQPLEEDWLQRLSANKLDVKFILVSDCSDALEYLQSANVISLIIFSEDPNESLERILNSFQQYIGCLNDFQAIVCNNPSPMLMATAFEYGTDQFLNRDSWTMEAIAITRNAFERLSDTTSPEFRIMALTHAINRSYIVDVRAAEIELDELTAIDFRAALTKGRAQEARSNFKNAAEAFELANSMNRIYRPTSSSLGEILILLGRFDDAITIFKRLAKSNPWFCEHQANLAIAYSEKGDLASAASYLEAARTLTLGSNKVREAEVHLALAKGDSQTAIGLLDKLDRTGAILATKLNRYGIQLSKDGQPEKALQLYQLAHRIVHPVQRHKVSLNIALAYYRLGEHDDALSFIEQSASEYGSSFAKLERVRTSILRAKAGKTDELESFNEKDAA